MQRVFVRVPDWGNTAWCYLNPFDELKPGDWVIVEQPLRNGVEEVIPGHSGIPVLGQVSGKKVDSAAYKKATKWIVQPIDWEPHRARCALVPPPTWHSSSTTVIEGDD